MSVPLIKANGRPQQLLELNLEMLTDFLVTFLRDEVSRKGYSKVLVALSGGVDSALTCYLAAKAFGPQQVYAIRLPYQSSSPDSLMHAQLVVEALGVHSRTIEITAAVDGYARLIEGMTPHRKGNLMSRVRMMIGFDQSQALNALPLGTGNKTERMFGYYTWHGDDAPPVNPLGDLFKTQVWALAKHLGVPEVIIGKPPSADLIPGQSDEADLGISYEHGDTILAHLMAGYEDAYLISLGFSESELALVKGLVAKTHWKRKPSISAMVSSTAIDEFYLRPVDY